MTVDDKRYRKRVGVLAALVVATGAAGNALLRIGMSAAGPLMSLSPFDYIRDLFSVTVALGVVVLIVNFILELSLLSWADLTYVLPVTSATYAIIPVVGVLGLHEHVSAAHWAGVLLILFGVVIVGRTKPLTVGEGPS